MLHEDKNVAYGNIGESTLLILLEEGLLTLEFCNIAHQ
jgi:hypothetical protein